MEKVEEKKFEVGKKNISFLVKKKKKKNHNFLGFNENDDNESIFESIEIEEKEVSTLCEVSTNSIEEINSKSESESESELPEISLTEHVTVFISSLAFVGYLLA